MLRSTESGTARRPPPPPPPTISGQEYVSKLIKYLSVNKTRLATPPYTAVVERGTTNNSNHDGTQGAGHSGGYSLAGNFWQQSYTIATLGLDPKSSPLNPTLAQVFSLGIASPATAPRTSLSNSAPQRGGSGGQSGAEGGARRRPDVKPLTLRLPPDRLLYLILLFQASSNPSIKSSPNLGKTDVPLPPGTHVAGARQSHHESIGQAREGDVRSVQSWVGSLKSVGGVFGSGSGSSNSGSQGSSSSSSWTSWFGGGGSKRETMDDGKTFSRESESLCVATLVDPIVLGYGPVSFLPETKLRLIYAAFTILPSLCLTSPLSTDYMIKELYDENSYTPLGTIDVRIPLNVFRSLLALELDGIDPRAILVDRLPGLLSLTVKGVPDGEDWLEDLLGIESKNEPKTLNDSQDDGDDDRHRDPERQARFPSLRHLSLPSTSLLSLPDIPCPALTHIDLSSNLLNNIPTSLSALTQLESINLSNNMIESVRGVEAILPNVVAVNLRNNRIDCLAGLDRLPRLQRIDLRKNEIHDVDEVGRLALCPRLKEIWVGKGNPYLVNERDSGSESLEWKKDVFRAFMEEGNETVLLDGYEMTWAERRAVQADMQKMGRTPKKAAAAVSAAPAAPHPHHDKSLERDAIQQARATTPLNKRNRKQRIVNLDGSVRMDSLDSEENGQGDLHVSGGGLDRTASPDHVSSSDARSEEDRGMTTTDLDRPSKRSTKPRQPSIDHPTKRTTTTDTLSSAGKSDANRNELSPAELRAKMEALKLEVGDSWLKVLAGQQHADAGHPARRQSTMPHDDTNAGGARNSADGRRLSTSQTSNRAEADVSSPPPQPQGQDVVQVVKRSKKKKKKAV